MSVATAFSLLFLLCFSPAVSASAIDGAAKSPHEAVVTKIEACGECEDMQAISTPIIVTEPCDECEDMNMPSTTTTCSTDHWRVHPFTSGTCTYYIPTCSPITKTLHHTHTFYPTTHTITHTKLRHHDSSTVCPTKKVRTITETVTAGAGGGRGRGQHTVSVTHSKTATRGAKHAKGSETHKTRATHTKHAHSSKAVTHSKYIHSSHSDRSKMATHKTHTHSSPAGYGKTAAHTTYKKSATPKKPRPYKTTKLPAYKTKTAAKPPKYT